MKCSVHLYDSKSSEVLEGAFVQITGSGKPVSGYSDDSGNVQFEKVATGNYQLSVSHIGYAVFVKEVSISNETGQVAFEVALVPEREDLNAAIINSVRAGSSTPSTHTNLDKVDIQARDQGKDFPFLLNTTPSTVISSDAGNGVGYTGIRIRGIDPTRVNVTINGIPLNDAESQGTFWVDLPDLASSTQSVQVQRGLGTSTNGAAAFGASVNVRTDRIPKEKFTRVDLGLGSFNTGRTTVTMGSGLLKNHWAFQLRGSVIGSDGFIDRASSDLKSMNLTAVRYWKKATFKTNVLLGTERTYQAWWGIPEPKFHGDQAGVNRYINQLWISGNDLENLNSSNSKTYNYYTYENEVDNYTQNHYQFFFDKKLSGRLKLNTAAFVTTGKGYFEQFRSQDDLSDYGLPSVIQGGDTFNTADLVRRRWLDNIYTGVLASMNYEKRKLSATLGGGYNLYTGRHFGEVIATEFTGYEDLNAVYYDNDAVKSDANIFFRAKYRIRNFIPYVDVQWRGVDYRFEGLDNNLEFGDQRVKYNFINPKVGMTYQYRRSRFYVLYAIGNREPVRDDFRNNPPNDWPEHETLNNTEIGYRFLKDGKQFGINFYDMAYKNQLVLTGAVNDVGEAVRTNVDQSYRRGVELEFQFPATPKLQIGANATVSENKIEKFTEYVYEWDGSYQTFTFEHNNTDISFSPNVIAAGMVNYRPNEHWSLDLVAKYVGRQYLDNTQNEARSLDAFVNTDASCRYSTEGVKGIKKLTAGFYLNNVFNRFYAPNGYTFSGYLGGQRADFNYFYPMAGRNIMVKVSITM